MAPWRSSRCESKSIQKDLIVTGTIAEAPDAICHKSDVRSSHYDAGNHMVSGVFRLYCPVEMRVGHTGRRLLRDLLKMNGQQACHFQQIYLSFFIDPLVLRRAA